MRKLRFILPLVLCIALALSLSSCEVINGLIGGEEEAPCADGHSFSEEWYYDSVQHWHAATCEHGDVKGALAMHSYVDGTCVCGAIEPTTHQHIYSTVWSYDAVSHWHAATCEHSELKLDEAEHSYVGGACICGAVEPHEHTYESKWSTSASKHWHASTCGHDVKSDEAEHEYGEDLICDECGYEHEHTYSKKWESDGDKHWKSATCEHSGAVFEAAHEYGEDFVCDECGYEHEHTYSDKWTSNGDKHWHAAICGHDVRGEEAAHAYVNSECACGAIENHEHTYSDEWTSDANNHWHKSTCGHNVIEGEAPHAYGDDFVCDECGYEHGHTYSDEWESDAEGHWHESDCGHAGFTTAKSAHVYGDDFVCDECGYEHEHTFEEKWSYDEDKHWHASTCGHDVRGDEAEHFLGGDDACVSNCGYKYVAPHVHTYSSKWSKDETNHWHAPTCSDTDEVIDLEAHTYGDDDVCDVCEMIKPIVVAASDIEQGGWAYGVKKTNAKRIRTAELIFVKKGTVIRYDPNGFQICLDLATAPDATTGDRAFWLTEAGEYVVQADAYLGITVAVLGGGSAIAPSAYACDITVFPGTGEIEMTYEKRNVYKYKEAAEGDAGNYWCFVYLPEGYDPDRAEPYPFVIANHGNGWIMDGSAKKANWTDVCMYMSATEIAAQSASKQSRYIETDDASLWYSNPTIEALLAAGYIVCGAQNYGDNLYGNDDCTNACVDFFNHMTETYNVEDACYMMGASNGAMTTLGTVAKLGEKVKSIILHYPLASIIEQYLSGNHQDNIEAAYGLDTTKTYTESELIELIGEYDVLYHNVVNGVKQGYFPSVQIYYSSTDTTTPASANAIPLMDMLHASGIECDGVRIDTDGTNKAHGHVDHFDPEACVAWFEAH